MSHQVSLRVDDDRLSADATLLLRLGTDTDVDQTIKASLGNYLSYASVLAELGIPGAGALTLSVYCSRRDALPSSTGLCRSSGTTGRRPSAVSGKPGSRSGPPTSSSRDDLEPGGA